MDDAPVRRAITRIGSAPGRADRLVHLERRAAREASFAEWPRWAPAEVIAAFQARGVERPWAHQAIAADAAYAGQHVVLATGTASGKSLAYQLPALSGIRTGRADRRARGAAALYIAPTKALAQDQLNALDLLGLDVRAVTHDGDSSREQRDWAREHGEWLLTNPDMLHRSMLPAHHRWGAFFGALRFVVVDECHHYRGVFGAHVAQVLRRLRRICARYGSHPTFVLASATVADPELSAGRLTGLEVLPVTADCSPQGELTLALWEPPFTSYAGEQGAPVRRGAASETADLLTDLVVDGMRTLAFVRSRRGVEQVATTAAGLLEEIEPGLGARVASYRGGYLPEERRAIEDDLRSGRLLGLAATNALELGIDVSGLDAVLLAGYPGTRAAFWQQIGRAGRRGRDSLGLLVARDDPLDTYLVHHPETLLHHPVEQTVFDPGNPHVLRPHLCAAAQELPLTEPDLDLFGPTAPDCVEGLVTDGLLRRRPRGWYWTTRDRAADLTDLRSAGGGPVQLVDGSTGRVIGTEDAGRAHGSVHPGAVYVHRGETWLVTSLDIDERVAIMSPTQVDYTTSAREVTDVTIHRVTSERAFGRGTLALGEVDVTHQVVSFLKRRRPSGEVVAEEPLDLPPRSLRTVAMWWTLTDDVLDEAGIDEPLRPGAAHAAEHCSIGLLPLVATCDRWDIGGMSTAWHSQTERLTVFVYDGYPGGAGFAERGHEAAYDWLHATRSTIADCECLEGCPSCVQSPKCGNQNNPLEKAAAITLLDALLGSP